MLNDVMSKPQLLNPDLYIFSLYENPSFIIVSAETEYISTRSWYRKFTFLSDRIRRIFDSPGPVVCFSDKNAVSRNQNNCYWPLHNESIARCKQHIDHCRQIRGISPKMMRTKLYLWSR